MSESNKLDKSNSQQRFQKLKEEIVKNQNNSDIFALQKFEELLSGCFQCTEAEKDLIIDAFLLSFDAYKGMHLRSGEPYIISQLEVARILDQEIGLGATAIASAILRNIVDDTDYTIEEIEDQFGQKITATIDGLTRISGVFNNKSSIEAEKFRKFLLSMTEDISVILIQIAGRLHFMRSLGSMPSHKIMKAFGETIYLYAPLAQRLGLHRIRVELEELSLKYRYPKIYSDLEKKVEGTYKKQNEIFEVFKKPITERLDAIGLKYEITNRYKSIYSIWIKMQHKNIPFDEVYDLTTIEIVFDSDSEFSVSEKSQCWNIYAIVTDFYKPKPDRLRDWVSHPKRNGYEALHITVMDSGGRWVEVQIRSKRMDEIAQRGFFANEYYNKRSGQEIDRIKEMLEATDADTLEFLDEFKLNLFASETIIYTPKGEVKTLEKDSTVLDFAFHLHTEIGYKAIGGKVNYKLVPVSHKLQNGDQVEILTSEKQTLNAKYLEWAHSNKARNAIKKLIAKTNSDFDIVMFEKQLSRYKYGNSLDMIYNFVKKDSTFKYPGSYAYFFNPKEKLDDTLKKINKSKHYFNYLTDLWYLSGENKVFDISSLEKESIKVNALKNKTKKIKESERIREVRKEKNILNKRTSEELGELLEKSVLELFGHFFSFQTDTEKFILNKLRQQPRGLQFGFDVEFNCEIKGHKNISGLVECKNISAQGVIKVGDVSNKIMSRIYGNENKPDFWILICPHVNPNNELNEHIKLLNAKEEINFQIWSPETFVDEFFGIVPKIYERFNFPERTGYLNPWKWTTEKKNEVIEKWKSKLIPKPQIAKEWLNYVRRPSNFLLNNEKDNAKEFDRLYFNHIKRYCWDDDNEVEELDLDQVVQNWLKTPIEKEPTLFLLGDFGDGKSTYTYILCRYYADYMMENPKDSWIAIRFSLKNFSFETERPYYNFLEESLHQIGLTRTDWHNLINQKKDKVLLILDGFDEISKNMDQKTINSNFEKLINYYNEYFRSVKVLLTSRKHFLSHPYQKERLLGRIGNPKLYHLRPFKKSKVIEHIDESLETPEDREKFEKLRTFYDPIGLATKPLFLEMLKESISDLPEKDINESILYDTYIKKCLSRKVELIDRDEIEIGYDEIRDNLTRILKEVALLLHKQKREYVYLSEISNKKNELNYARKLWELTRAGELEEDDATSRVAARSLLTRIKVTSDDYVNKWPVDFFHRSLKEYFVALGLMDLLDDDISGFIKYLKSVQLNSEILHFLSNIMRDSKVDYVKKLLYIISETEQEGILISDDSLASLGCNTLNLLYRYKEELPGQNWSNLTLDGVNLSDADLTKKDFSNTSLKYANLDNVIFKDANFSNANLKGVKIEETSDIISIAINNSSDCFYALYDDLTIKEWTYNNNIKKHPRTVLQLDPEIGYGKMMFHTKDNLLYYTKDGISILERNKNGMYHYHSKIDLKQGVSIYKLKRDYLLMVSSQKDRKDELYVIDIRNRKLVGSLDYIIGGVYENLNSKTIIYYHKTEGLFIGSLTTDSNQKIESEPDDITSLSSFEISNGNYLLTVGDSNGKIYIYRLKYNGKNWHIVKLLVVPVHSESIRDILFVNQNTLLTSSSDKRACILSLKTDCSLVTNKRYHFLKMQCKNLNIEGLKEEKEYNKLLKFINMEA